MHLKSHKRDRVSAEDLAIGYLVVIGSIVGVLLILVFALLAIAATASR